MLTAKKIREETRAGVYTDGPGRYGLALLVKAGAHGTRRTFTQRLTLNGKRIMVGLGKCEFVKLSEARTMAFENARAAARGEALPHGGARRNGAKVAEVPAFRQLAERYIAKESPAWKTGTVRNWRSALKHCEPFADRPINAVTTDDVVSVIDALVSAGTIPIAKSVRGCIRAIVKGHSANLDDDRIDAALPRNGHKTKHRESVPYAEVPSALRSIRSIDKATWRGMVAATEFLILTGTRSSEVTGANWNEIDLDAATWTIPASRMKMDREHRIPLSRAALDVLRAQRERSRTGLIFRAPRGGEIDRLIPVLREVGIDADIHGFRSSLRDWCSENGVDDTTAERCIAHYETDSTRKAYHRTDRFEDRRPVMQAWADYVTTGETTA